MYEKDIRVLLALDGHGALALLADQRLVDVGDDAAPGDGGLDQRVQLLVSSEHKHDLSNEQTRI